MDEANWIALRELVPAATAPLRLAPDLVATYGEREITLVTVLPMAWPGLVKADGRIFIGAQRTTRSGDLSRDLAVAVLNALTTDPGSPVSVPALPGPGPRLQDILADGPLDIRLADGFDFWLDGQTTSGEVKAALERANASVFPTVRLTAASSAYWCRISEKAHVRWVLPEPEETALLALSRLAAARELTLGETTRFAGMFRAHGLLIPVWDVPADQDASVWEEPVAAFAERYRAALATGDELDDAVRRARRDLQVRQVTLR